MASDDLTPIPRNMFRAVVRRNLTIELKKNVLSDGRVVVKLDELVDIIMKVFADEIIPLLKPERKVENGQ